MDLAAYAALDGTGLAEAVRAGSVSAGELVETAHRAANGTAGTVGAVAEFYTDRLEQVTEVDAGLPFAGVPIMMKDVGFHERGRSATCGSALLEGVMAAEDSELMRRLRAAGVTSVGRTTASEFAIMATVETRAYGITRNPWDGSRIAGGSSGGAAAAVAAGIVPVAHGNDGGGSIRMPAACCGVVGMKPSRGRVSSAPWRRPVGDLVYEFVLTRSVRDSARMLDVLAGPDPDVTHGLPTPEAGYAGCLERPSEPLRIGYTLERMDGRPTDPEVRAGVERAVELCAALGHEMVECRPELPYESYVEATLAVWGLETAIAVDEAALASGRPADDEHLEGLTLAWAEHGRRLTPLRLGRALDVLDDVRRRMNRFMAGFDAYVSSTLPVLPPPLGTYDPDLDVPAEWYYGSPVGQLEVTTMVFNCSGQPAISIPLEVSVEGLPIGIHLAAPHGRDDTVLQLAADLERAAPWRHRLPPVHVSRIG
ncbi:amidase family protein [Geodermatophilus arenarius]|uniref:Amidase n=1 Tax=Geodermatophilus arenarius TaxID=1137990 RepID=A0ABV9LCU6_9ACTN